MSTLLGNSRSQNLKKKKKGAIGNWNRDCRMPVRSISLYNSAVPVGEVHWSLLSQRHGVWPADGLHAKVAAKGTTGKLRVDVYATNENVRPVVRDASKVLSVAHVWQAFDASKASHTARNIDLYWLEVRVPLEKHWRGQRGKRFVSSNDSWSFRRATDREVSSSQKRIASVCRSAKCLCFVPRWVKYFASRRIECLGLSQDERETRQFLSLYELSIFLSQDELSIFVARRFFLFCFFIVRRVTSFVGWRIQCLCSTTN